jgi:magnesium-protoporphyrin O-methyltransferase
MVFTIAPSTAFLKAFWMAGQVFPRSDRSPQIIPHSDRSLQTTVQSDPALTRFTLGRVRRVSRGFYISQAMELAA